MSNGSFTVVPTPVGNLKDITYRAVEVLKDADIIFAEDTRTALALLNHLSIKNRVESYHKDNEARSSERIIELLDEGRNIALISEAGTPCISDPGYVITAKLAEEGYPFTALPGATAFVPALVMSGFDTSEFHFRGFLPQKSGEKNKELERLSALKGPVIFYESPKRAKDTLRDILNHFTPPISISREISKVYEECIRIETPEQIDEITERGEFVIIAQNKVESENSEEGNINFFKTASELLKEKFSSKDAVKILKILGMKRNSAYELVQQIVDGSSDKK